MKKQSLLPFAAALLACPTLAIAQSAITLNPTALTFNGSAGNVTAQRTLVTSSGTAPVTVNSVSFNKNNFALSTIALPLTLAPGKSAYFYVRANPEKSTTTTTGTMTFSTSAGNKTLPLTITAYSATTQHSVSLTWKGSSSSSVDSYEVDRELGTAGGFTRLASTGASGTSWSDTTVQSGKQYTYEVKALTSTGATSGPSNVITVSIP